MDSYAAIQQSPAYIIISLVCAIIGIVANWKIFTKAGEKGWKSIIPIYNGYTSFKLFWNVKMFWITLVLAFALSISITIAGVAGAMGSTIAFAVLMIVYLAILVAMLVIAIIHTHRMSKSFGHGAGFTVGLIFLSVIFVLILAFGKSEYKKLEN